MSDLIYLAYANDPAASEDKKKKEIEYKKYVDEHRSNVEKAWSHMRKHKKVLDYIESVYQSNMNILLSLIDNQIQSHDMSKYGIEEWEPYRMYFYPVDDQEKIDSKVDFEKAWEHHYTKNLHHWNWWAYNNQKDKTPLNYIIEMCCDWIAMSMKFGGDAYHWYLKQTDIKLGDKQKEWTENILMLYYNLK